MFEHKTAKTTPWRTPSSFAESHCMKCTLGWTRRSKDNSYLVICLLDRDPVLPETASCSRFETKEQGL